MTKLGLAAIGLGDINARGGRLRCRIFPIVQICEIQTKSYTNENKSTTNDI